MNYPLTYAQYQQGLAEGKLLGLKCSGCGEYVFPARSVCPGCSGHDLKPEEITPQAVLRTFTVIRVAPEGRKPPYVVALAEMQQGPWVIGIVEGIEPDQANMDLIGRTVTVTSQVVPGDVYSDETRALTFNLAS